MEFSPSFLLWAPVVLLFLSAIVSAVIRRNSKDPCLKAFNDDGVVIQMKDGGMLWGTLRVYPDCLELVYHQSHPAGEGRFKKSYVLYNKKVAEIDRIYRPAPEEGSEDRTVWEKELWRLRNPGLMRRLGRFWRTIFSVLQDAFNQALGLIVGMAKRSSKGMQQVAQSDKHATEVGQTLLKVLPNAYEPVLERYIGHGVVVEHVCGSEILETQGVLQDYSQEYLILRGVKEGVALPEAGVVSGYMGGQADVVFPRRSAIVRHLLEGTIL